MNSKPTFKTKVKEKVKRAKRELEQEDKPLIRTTISIDVDLLCSVKQLAVKRKRAGNKPDTVTGIIREALTKIVQAKKL